MSHPYINSRLNSVNEALLKQQRYDQLYMDFAMRVAEESQDNRLRVGAVFVKNDAVISLGFNGTPPKTDNQCEEYKLQHVNPYNDDSTLIFKGQSKALVVHAEMNALAKLARSTFSAEGASVYCTDSCCLNCAIALGQARIAEFVYQYPYRLTAGIDHLKSQGIKVRRFGYSE